MEEHLLTDVERNFVALLESCGCPNYVIDAFLVKCPDDDVLNVVMRMATDNSAVVGQFSQSLFYAKQAAEEANERADNLAAKLKNYKTAIVNLDRERRNLSEGVAHLNEAVASQREQFVASSVVVAQTPSLPSTPMIATKNNRPEMRSILVQNKALRAKGRLLRARLIKMMGKVAKSKSKLVLARRQLASFNDHKKVLAVTQKLCVKLEAELATKRRQSVASSLARTVEGVRSAELDRVKEQLAVEASRSSSLQEQLQNNKDETARMERNFTERLAEKRVQLGRLHEELSCVKSQLDVKSTELDETLAKFDEEMMENRHTIEALRCDLEKAKKQRIRSPIKMEVEQHVENDRLKEENQSLTTKVAADRRTIEKLRVEIATLFEENRALRRDLSALSKRNAEKLLRADKEFKEKIDQLRDEKAKLNDQLCVDIEELRKMSQQVIGERDSLRYKVDRLTRELDQAKMSQQRTQNGGSKPQPPSHWLPNVSPAPTFYSSVGYSRPMPPPPVVSQSLLSARSSRRDQANGRNNYKGNQWKSVSQNRLGFATYRPY